MQKIFHASPWCGVNGIECLSKYAKHVVLIKIWKAMQNQSIFPSQATLFVIIRRHSCARCQINIFSVFGKFNLRKKDVTREVGRIV